VKLLYSLYFTKKTVRIQVKEDLICHFSDMVRRIRFPGLFAFGFGSKGRLVLMPMILRRMARKV